MKRLLLVPFGLLALVSCKEKGPLIDFGSGPKPQETSFMAPVETPDQRIVLIEEFTGVTCPTCKAGHTELKKLEDLNPGRLAIMGIQIIGNAQTRPYDKNGKKTLHDNRTQDGTDLASGVFGATSGIPVAAFDRTPQGGLMRPLRPNWASYLPNRIDVPTNANIKITSNYTYASRQAVIKVHVAYTSDVTANQMLTVALVENDVVDAQELPAGDTAEVELNYVHQHVLRDIITAPVGDIILSSMPTKSAGQVYERTFVYTLPATVLDPANCRIIAYVSDNNGDDKQVQQAAEAHLK
jgi:hypothetical protein